MEGGGARGSPSMLCPTIMDRLCTTVVNSMEVMSSMHPSDSSITTVLSSFCFSLSFSFSVLEESFST